MKKVYFILLPLMTYLFASCGKEDDIVAELPIEEPEKEAVYETNDDYVDLGFDGILFATKNLGAKNPEDSGDFFAWGKQSQRMYIGGQHTNGQTHTTKRIMFGPDYPCGLSVARTCLNRQKQHSL